MVESDYFFEAYDKRFCVASMPLWKKWKAQTVRSTEAITPELLTGQYIMDDPTNDWHYFSIWEDETTAGLLHMVNNAGCEFDYVIDQGLQQMVAAPGTTANTADIQFEETAGIAGPQYAGIHFGDKMFRKHPPPAIMNSDICGDYIMDEPTNDWHYFTIWMEGTSVLMKNRAEEQWEVAIGGTCRLVAGKGESKEVKARMCFDAVTGAYLGLNFGDKLCRKQ